MPDGVFADVRGAPAHIVAPGDIIDGHTLLHRLALNDQMMDGDELALVLVFEREPDAFFVGGIYIVSFP